MSCGNTRIFTHLFVLNIKDLLVLTLRSTKQNGERSDKRVKWCRFSCVSLPQRQRLLHLRSDSVCVCPKEQLLHALGLLLVLLVLLLVLLVLMLLLLVPLPSVDSAAVRAKKDHKVRKEYVPCVEETEDERGATYNFFWLHVQ